MNGDGFADVIVTTEFLEGTPPVARAQLARHVAGDKVATRPRRLPMRRMRAPAFDPSAILPCTEAEAG